MEYRFATIGRGIQTFVTIRATWTSEAWQKARDAIADLGYPGEDLMLISAERESQIALEMTAADIAGRDDLTNLALYGPARLTVIDSCIMDALTSGQSWEHHDRYMKSANL